MSTTQPKFDLDALIAMADEIRSANPDILPFDLMVKMSGRILAEYIPEHAEVLRPGNDTLIKGGMLDQSLATKFAEEMLIRNNLYIGLPRYPEMQEKLLGGCEALLFQGIDEPLIEFYRKKIGKTPEPFDPLTAPGLDF